MIYKEIPDLDVLNSLLYLDPTIPQGLRWKADAKNHKKDAPAGVVSRDGRYVIYICDSAYAVHRLIWSIANNCKIPTTLQIDHIDRNPSNNDSANLRLATNSQNSRNRKSRGKSKYSGVSYITSINRWKSSIRDAYGKKRYLGLYLCEKEAARAYNKAVIDLGLTEFTRLNEV